MRLQSLCLSVWCAISGVAGAVDSLPRGAGKPSEEHPGVVVEYGSLAVGGGVRLRTILTRPKGIARPPVILFVQWLSCDTIELSTTGNDGWTQMLRGMVRSSGWAVMRTDKRGVGDSEGGPCTELDYQIEVADHQAALAALRDRTDVDTSRMVVFGASMGARMAPQVEAGQSGVVGILTWGGGAETWFERMLAFDRHALELGGSALVEVNARMKDHAMVHARYLLEGEDPPTIIRSEPGLADVWSEIVGSGADHHYGRPFAFHHQAQRADWAAAWARVDVPVLVTMGEYDWFENRAGHETVVRVVNSRRPRLARFAVVPKMDHHFTLFNSPEAAFRDEGGRPDAEPFLKVALPWLDQRAAQ